MSQFREGTVIADRFVVGRLLGQGGMGVVHLAYDRQLACNIALKMITPARSAELYDLQHFQLEAIALASIRSRNVVALHSFGRSRQTCYYAMDFVEGATVEQLIARKSVPLAPDFVLAAMRDVACGLDDVHRAGFVHRDVKPSNILIEERTDRAVLFDFGLVFRWRNPDGKETDSARSPLYMAPEQGIGSLEAGCDEIGPWTDEYALACSGFEMLAGEPPFTGSCSGSTCSVHPPCSRSSDPSSRCSIPYSHAPSRRRPQSVTAPLWT